LKHFIFFPSWAQSVRPTMTQMSSHFLLLPDWPVSLLLYRAPFTPSLVCSPPQRPTVGLLRRLRDLSALVPHCRHHVTTVAPLFPIGPEPPTRHVSLKSTVAAQCDGFFSLISPSHQAQDSPPLPHVHIPVVGDCRRPPGFRKVPSPMHFPPSPSVSRRPDRHGPELMWESHPSPTL
jgi:hypothetical protein